MSIIGIGTDIVENARIKKMIEQHSEHFVERVFTAREIQYCTERKASEQHFAARWTAKEAVLKVLGTGWIAGITWTDVEVVKDASGAPHIALYGQAASIAAEKGIDEIQITLSHCKEYAVAFAVGILTSKN